jgi:hypothetical protein
VRVPRSADDREFRVRPDPLDGHGHLAASRGELGRVGEQIGQHLAQPLGITADDDPLRGVHRDGEAGVGVADAQRLDGLPGQVAEVHRAGAQREPGSVGGGQGAAALPSRPAAS